ncbi:MAG: hypothetical protein AAGF93_00535 [Cyanobacteria bacterium P01_H01_bin.105]
MSSFQEIVLDYGVTLDPLTTPLVSHYSVSNEATVASVRVLAQTIIIRLSTEVFDNDDIVTISYDPGDAPLLDINGFFATPFTNLMVTNNLNSSTSIDFDLSSTSSLVMRMI